MKYITLLFSEQILLFYGVHTKLLTGTCLSVKLSCLYSLQTHKTDTRAKSITLTIIEVEKASKCQHTDLSSENSLQMRLLYFSSLLCRLESSSVSQGKNILNIFGLLREKGYCLSILIVSNGRMGLGIGHGI